MAWYVHVNRNTIASNAKNGSNEPAVRIQRGRHGPTTYCFETELPEGSKMIYSPHDPILPCGARLVIECPSEPKVIR